MPVAERVERLERRRHAECKLLEQSQSPKAGVFRRLADWDDYVIGDTYAPANDGLKGRRVGDIAAERGASIFGTLLDIVVADELPHGAVAARRRTTTPSRGGCAPSCGTTRGR